MPRKAAWRHSLTLNLLLLILIYKEEIPMSHFSTLRTKITDAEILKASLRDLVKQRGLQNANVKLVVQS